MTHDYIAEQDLVGRYNAGMLPYDERTRFEAHFVDCPRCLDALEDVESFRNALRAVAGEADTPRRTNSARTWMQRVVGLAAAAVIAVGIVDAVRMRREVARAKAAADASERERLDAEQRVHDLSTTNAATATQENVAAGALVFPLVKTRSALGGPPQNRVTISADAGWVVLLADVSTSSASSSFRAIIDRIGGGRVWSNDRLSLSSTDTVGVAVPARLLTPGDYDLTLDERPATSDGWRSAGRFMFRVTAPR